MNDMERHAACEKYFLVKNVVTKMNHTINFLFETKKFLTYT